MAQLASVRRTATLTLRRWELDDLDDLALIYASAQVARYLYWETRDRGEALVALERSINRPLEVIDENVLGGGGSQRDWPGGRRFILRWTDNERRQGEIGGSLDPEYHGQGLAVEVYRELLQIGFADLSLHRIVGRCDARNSASIRALEKVGISREAHFIENEFVKGEWADEIVLAIRNQQGERREVDERG